MAAAAPKPTILLIRGLWLTPRSREKWIDDTRALAGDVGRRELRVRAGRDFHAAERKFRDSRVTV